MTNCELILGAAELVRPHKVGDRLFGDVASVLVSASGATHRGVCIDTGGNGFCAEQAAIGAMVTTGEYRVKEIVAVWKDDTGSIYVLPPCGSCREFIRSIDPDNLNTEIVLGVEDRRPLRELLPYHEWPAPTPGESL